jgi:hypothetical protein
MPCMRPACHEMAEQRPYGRIQDVALRRPHVGDCTVIVLSEPTLGAVSASIAITDPILIEAPRAACRRDGFASEALQQMIRLLWSRWNGKAQ